MLVSEFPDGVLIHEPSPEGAARWLRSVPLEKWLDASLLSRHEAAIVEWVAAVFPRELVAFHAELMARQGRSDGGSCLAPVALGKGDA